MKLAEILSGPETWCKGTAHMRGEERYCLYGALGALISLERLNNYDECTRLYDECTRLVRVMKAHGCPGLTSWNDAPSTTWEEVAAVVDAYDRDRLLNP